MKGAGPYMNMLTTNSKSPANWINPYFIPLRSSLTKFRPNDVREYVIVSIEKTRPICVTFKFFEPSMSASTGSLKVRHISESDTHMAIVTIYYSYKGSLLMHDLIKI